MNAVEIIAKKRDGGKLSRGEIGVFINLYVSGKIPDYQMSAFLMAVFFRGMDFEETGWLTEIMLDSGEKVTFQKPDNIYVDKHSTGGVGDKVSLILAPLAASCGIKVPMLSGRGLGYTGGTLDKLESIPGFRTDLSLKEFQDGVERVGCVISGQTASIAPADRLMYALRDVTGTVESIPLICGSILSKKFAAGPRGIVFDVKCGNGAFMKNEVSAEVLAENLIAVGKGMGRKVTALITDMNQPLGETVGNLLELVEAMDFLKGKQAPDLYGIILELSAEMLIVSGLRSDYDEAKILIKSKLEDGSAWSKFEEMVSYQRGDLSIFAKTSDLPQAAIVDTCKSSRSGWLTGMATEEIGRLIVELGGGRKTKESGIDRLVGFKFFKKIGDEIKSGEPLAEVHAGTREQAGMAIDRLKSIITIGPEPPEIPALIYRRLS